MNLKYTWYIHVIIVNMGPVRCFFPVVVMSTTNAKKRHGDGKTSVTGRTTQNSSVSRETVCETLRCSHWLVTFILVN